MDEERPVPDAAAIRRALAECMTLNDIDDAMGWATGTARRRRWLDPGAGGLPPADAELGGMPLWFRATMSGWRAREHGRAWPGDAAPVDADGDAEAPTGTPTGTPTEPRTGADTAGAADEGTRDDDGDGDGGGDDYDDGGSAVPDDDRTEAPGTGVGIPANVVPGPGAGDDEPERQAVPGAAVGSGFALAPGQEVLAFVRGAWYPAVVAGRARHTVVVDYQLGPGPLGARRQRVALDRIRLRDR